MSTPNPPEKKKSWRDFEKPPDFVHQVAEYAWRRGLTANRIAKEIGFPGDAQAITAVKRALQKAIKDGTLVLNMPSEIECREDLKRMWSRINFTIVRNDLVAKGDAVHIAASSELAAEIEALWNTDKKEIVIANAGGHAVSETVRYLHQIHRPVLDDAMGKRLIFISLNSAGRSRMFQQSSNYLSVRLAEIYGGEHITLLGPADRSADEDYRRLIDNIDLLICGAGGRDSLLAQRAEEEGINLSSEMVGDLAFIPLDENGRRIQDPHLQTVTEEKLHAAPAYDEILRIAAHPPRAVMVVLTGASKLPIALAILRAGLPSHVILDLSLAKSLIKCGG